MSRLTIVALAVAGLLLLGNVARGAVVYLNTFDDSGNVNLGTDSTDAPSIFTNTGFGSGTVTEEPFNSSLHSNTLGAQASGNHAVLATGFDTSWQITTNQNQWTQGLADLINTLPAGTYDLTLTTDMAWEDEGGDSQRSIGALMFSSGDFDSGGNGRWEGAFNLNFASGPDFERVGDSATFTLVDPGATSNLPEGTFTVGTIAGFSLSVKMDSRGAQASEIVRLDNVQFTSTTIPEPATLTLIAVGAALLKSRRRPA